MDKGVVGKDEVIAAVAVWRSLCARLDPNTIPMHDVPEVYDAFLEGQKLVDGATLRMTGRYEESRAWARNGAKSAEDDIADRSGSSKGAAKRRLSTSKRLASQPRTEDAVRSGELSEEQASEVSEGAGASPEDEEDLLRTARRRSLWELREKAARSRAKREDSEARARRLFKRRCMRRFRELDGMEALLLKVPPELMAEVDAFLNRFIDREFADARDRGQLEAREAYAADVVYRLLTGQAPNDPGPVAGPADEPAEETTEPGADTAPAGDEPAEEATEPAADTEPAGDDPADTAGEPGPAGGDAPARARNANAVRPDRKVLAIIDLRALNRGRVEGDETCEIAGVGPVSVTAIRAMLADSFLAVVIKDGVDVLNVTHLGRQVTAHQRTALEARGWWCERCGSTYRVQIDHDTGWTLTHDTRLEDLRLACAHCHDLKTRHDLRWHGPFGEGTLVDTQGNPWRAPPSPDRGTGPPTSGSDPPVRGPTGPTDSDEPTLFTLAD